MLAQESSSGTIHRNRQVETTQMSMTIKLIKKMWPVHTMEYFYGRDEVQIHTITWMSLESIPMEEARHKRSPIVYDSVLVECPEQADP